MARMRSIKPEFWNDLTLASQSRDARLLYIALWNQCDEHARMHGDRRWIKGHCFPYDDDLSLADIDRLLKELESAGKVVRYVAKGEEFLFLPKLAAHQRLEPAKVPSRLPEPPDSDENTPPTSTFSQGDDSTTPHATSSERRANESETNVAKHVAGGIEHVAGVPPSAARDSAQTLVGEWIDACRKRPPGNVVGQVGKAVAAMLAEGQDTADIRRGLQHWHQKGLHPSALPSVVNELMNASPNRGRVATTDQRVSEGLALAQRLAEQEAS